MGRSTVVVDRQRLAIRLAHSEVTVYIYFTDFGDMWGGFFYWDSPE